MKQTKERDEDLKNVVRPRHPKQTEHEIPENYQKIMDEIQKSKTFEDYLQKMKSEEVFGQVTFSTMEEKNVL